jgi:diguanylate cyclase (GGDEF)-like protein/PAS domain S-box-containing protein
LLNETEFESDGLLALVAKETPAALWSVDRNLVFESRQGVGLSGLRSTRNDAIGKSLFEFFATTDENHVVIAAHRRALQGESATYDHEHLGHFFKCFLLPRRDAAGAVVGVRGFALDTTTEHVMWESLRRSEETLALAQSAARLGSWTQDLAQGLVSWSEELFVLCGLVPYSQEPSLALLWRYIHPDDRIPLEAAIDVAREDRGAFLMDTRFVAADGTERWVQHRGRYLGETAESARIIGTVLDISSRKRAEAKTEHLANYDELTGLPNRKLFADRLQRSLLQAEHTGSQMAVLYLDLDRFKAINDTLGHDVGDRFLRGVAPRLTAAVRATDTVSRSGGDEFIIVLPEISSIGEAAHLAERVVASFAQPIEIDGRELYSSASIGISVYPDDGTTAEELIRAADAALFRAKRSGNGSFRFYAAATHARHLDRLELENAVRGAFDRSEFLLYYQPIVDRFERPVAFEALLRWERPEFGIVGPDTFIPLCEEIGLIVPLGRWVMRRACEQLAAWLQRGLPSVRLAMNISARQMLDPHLVGDLRGALAETGISPGTVELEITESVLMADVTGVRRVIGELKHLGVRISLDDFGTGYSGLSYLKNFSVDALKIDRTFVRDLPADRGDAAIVSSVVALGHAMGLRVVAEGVETAEQAGLVRRLGCDELQGFYFSKPMTIEALERTVRAWAL